MVDGEHHLNTDRQFVVALSRGLELLDCFRAERPTLTNGELARLSGLACSSVSRLTHTLVKLGYLDYDSGAKAYRLGLRLLAMHPVALQGVNLSQVAVPHMAELARETGESVSLSVYENYGLIVVQTETGNPAITASRYVGLRYPLVGTSMGRAYVARCSDHEQRDIVDHLSKVTPKEIPALQLEVDNAVASYRELGYAMALGAACPGKNGVAVSIHLQNLGRRALLTCGGPAHRVPRRRLQERIAPLLIQSAAAMERESVRRIRPALF